MVVAAKTTAYMCTFNADKMLKPMRQIVGRLARKLTAKKGRPSPLLKTLHIQLNRATMYRKEKLHFGNSLFYAGRGTKFQPIQSDRTVKTNYIQPAIITKHEQWTGA